ncbi:MAG TPA: AAA family ATPase, partial [Holophagaceae bacterium]|nr:AAA family ATPase [Holophagaceae bacterium]
MKLKKFSVSRYRSIIETREIDLSTSTVFVGPNNEGKSNLLRSLFVGLRLAQEADALSSERRMLRSSPVDATEHSTYMWQRDFPIKLQNKYPKGQTSFYLEFELSSQDRKDFQSLTGSTTSPSLPIEIKIGPRSFEYRFKKPGPVNKVLATQKRKVGQFVSERINIQYIPAIRTADNAREIVQSLLSIKLRGLIRDPQYQQALNLIEEIERPIVSSIASDTTDVLKRFIPSIERVQIDSGGPRSRFSRVGYELSIDDGNLTPIQHKGDGIISLVSLALMYSNFEQSRQGRGLVLAIEEPESHLHPDAIHEINNILKSLSQQHQILYTTHSPILVNKDSIKSNIIVKDNSASQAKNLKQVRECLGVRSFDNLESADLIIYVEGEGDEAFLRDVLSH